MNTFLLSLGVLCVLYCGSRAERNVLQDPSIETKKVVNGRWDSYEGGLNLQNKKRSLSDDPSQHSSTNHRQSHAVKRSLDSQKDALKAPSAENSRQNKNLSIKKREDLDLVGSGVPSSTGIINNPFGDNFPFGNKNNPFIGNFPFNVLSIIDQIKKPWHDGSNVCITRKKAGDNFASQFGIYFSESISKTGHSSSSFSSSSSGPSSFSFSSSGPRSSSFSISKSCFDTGKDYICYIRTLTNGVYKGIIERRQCCKGFVRSRRGCRRYQKKMMQKEKRLTLGFE